jgi:hypothetical protein
MTLSTYSIKIGGKWKVIHKGQDRSMENNFNFTSSGDNLTGSATKLIGSSSFAVGNDDRKRIAVGDWNHGYGRNGSHQPASRAPPLYFRASPGSIDDRKPPLEASPTARKLLKRALVC